MDMTRISMVLFAAPAGWLLALPLAQLADHLLAGVAADEAAPATFAPVLVTGGNADGMVAVVLPPVLTPPWRWTLRGGLAVAVPLALWRLIATPTFHPANLWAAGAFVWCIIALVLIAVLDGAAHLVFVEVVVPPVALVAFLGIVGGHALWLPLLLGGGVGGVLFLALYALGQLLYGTDALGFGDVELAAGFGVMLGWPHLLSGVILGMVLMAGATGMLLVLRRITTHTFVPIGAFLALGTLVTLLLIPPIWLA